MGSRLERIVGVLLVLVLAAVCGWPAAAQDARRNGRDDRQDATKSDAPGGRGDGSLRGDEKETKPEAGELELTAAERERLLRNRERDYAPRPTIEKYDPALEMLLDEIEDEPLQPLFGQGVFRQAIIDRAVREMAGPRPVSTPPPSYRVLPGDRFTITFWNALVAPRTVETEVLADGTVAFDPIGAVQVSGLTASEFESLLTRLIRLKGPREATVQLSFTALHAIRVGVTGEVRRLSTSVVLTGYATLFDALAAAGGPSAYASLRHIRLYRNGQAQEIDLYKTLLEGDPSGDISLRDGDRVHVPVAKLLVTVDGEVARSRRYEMTEDRTVAKALELAGSLQQAGSKIQIHRFAEDGVDHVWDFSALEVTNGKADLKPIEPLQSGDRVLVLEASAQPRVLELQGAVGRPGEYGFQPGMTLAQAVGLAQGVLAKGHAPIGTIRRSSPSGEVESLNFQISELLAGGPAAQMLVQVGDVIDIPLLESRPPIKVVVSGSVNEPGQYDLEAAYTVSDLLREAGGLAPGAALEARLLSTASGTAEETRIDLRAVGGGGEPTPNATLANGDRLVVPSLREIGAAGEVRVDGFVRSPGRFSLVDGMRLGDLLRQAGGLLPRAARRGKLVRVVPGTGDTTVRYVDFERALTGDEDENPLLQEEDQVVVDSAAEILQPVPPQVSIRGPVSNPGTYNRFVGMRVSDLLREAGGLHREADRVRATVVRKTDTGRVERLAFSPDRAMAGDQAQDLVLQNGDSIELEPWLEQRQGTRLVQISGAVYQPGNYTLTERMTLEELLYLAGGTTPDAYLARAILYRRAPLGRTRQVAFDLSLRPLNMPLEEGDMLRVFTTTEAVYQEPTVEVKGEVRREGNYERTEGMRLSDVIFVAGGLLREVEHMSCEVARPRSTQTVLLHPDLAAAMAGDEAQDLIIEDGDKVYLRTDGEYQHGAREVLVRGMIERPGFYPLASERGESLRELIVDRAGGLQADAFTEGAILLRRIDEIVHPEAARYVNEIYDTVRRKKRRDDYALAASKAGTGFDADRLLAGERLLPTELVQSDLAVVLGDRSASSLQRDLDVLSDRNRLADELLQTGSGSSGTQSTVGPRGVTTAETPESLRPYVRVSIDLQQVLDGTADLELRPNDILVVSSVPQTVMVMGEVNAPLGLTYAERQTVGYYLQKAGGGSRDADLKNLLIVRANGTLNRAAMNSVVGRGDIVLVPPLPLTIPRDRAPLEQVQAVAGILGGFATTILAISRAL